MNASRYVIPCLCGRTIESHAPETECPGCGRILVVEGREPKAGVPEPERRSGQFLAGAQVRL